MFESSLIVSLHEDLEFHEDLRVMTNCYNILQQSRTCSADSILFKL